MPPIPVTPIVGGCFYPYNPSGAPFILDTNDFAVEFHLADYGSIPINFLAGPGSTVDVSGKLSGGLTLNYGSVDFHGKQYPKLWFAGLMQFLAKPFVLPSHVHPWERVATTFTCKAHILAYTQNPNVNVQPPLFEFNTAGKGTASVRLSMWAPQKLSITSIAYTFAPF